jgi:hypothetical protein
MDNPWKFIAIVFIILFAILFAVDLVGGFSHVAGSPLFSTSAGPDASAQAAIGFIRANLTSQGESVSFLNVTEESGVYKIATVFTSTSGENRTIDVFMTKDGKMLFPAWYPVPASGNTSSRAAVTVVPAGTTVPAAMSCSGIPKQEGPVLDAFVVSYCPYGQQMQGVLVNISETVPTLAAHIKVRYIGEVSNGTVQSMHGPTEAAENLRQICIREEQPDRYWKYVSCFLSSGSSDACLKSATIDTTQLSGCTGTADRGLAYAKKDFALADTYGVSGSPTLILNGVTVSEFNFGGRTPDAVKSLLCCGFNSTQSSCNVTLSGSQGAVQGSCG